MNTTKYTKSARDDADDGEAELHISFRARIKIGMLALASLGPVTLLAIVHIMH